MSLAATASVWTNDNQTKKRQPTMRRSTIKLRPYNETTTTMDPDEYVSQSENYQNIQNLQQSSPPSIADIEVSNDDRKNKVNEMLNKITAFNAENDGSKLGNFVPLQPPNITNNRAEIYDSNSGSSPAKNLDPSDLLPKNLRPMNLTGDYLANDQANLEYSNYNKTYDSPKLFQKQPYYANMGISSPGDDKMMEKINYMIHMLEQQQSDKTANITEEFILYIFLGVFVIFIIDSFNRSGKYVR
jgi:hypothetical protein